MGEYIRLLQFSYLKKVGQMSEDSNAHLIQVFNEAIKYRNEVRLGELRAQYHSELMD